MEEYNNITFKSISNLPNDYMDFKVRLFEPDRVPAVTFHKSPWGDDEDVIALYYTPNAYYEALQRDRKRFKQYKKEVMELCCIDEKEFEKDFLYNFDAEDKLFDGFTDYTLNEFCDKLSSNNANPESIFLWYFAPGLGCEAQLDHIEVDQKQRIIVFSRLDNDD